MTKPRVRLASVLRMTLALAALLPAPGCVLRAVFLGNSSATIEQPAPEIVLTSHANPQANPETVTDTPQVFPIDLPTALRLADAQNPQIQFARERIRAAEAELERANVLWLPTISIGTLWTRHDGQIQDTRGPVVTVSRSALFVGGGPTAAFRLADALYEPLAARQIVRAQQADERAATNETLLKVALGYWELVLAQSESALAKETLEAAKKLDELAQGLFKAGKLKAADAERSLAEVRSRTQDLDLAQEKTQVASVRLAQMLRLDPFVLLQSVDKQATPLTLIDGEAPANELAALALGNRPELARSQALVQYAAEKLRQAKVGPFLPSLVVGYRAGGFGGGANSFFGNFEGRGDAEAGLVWDFHNLGLGDRAVRKQRDSELRLAQIRDVEEMDRIVAQVAEARNRVQTRRQQMKSAQSAVQSAVKSHDLNYKLLKEAGIEAIRPIEVLQSIQAMTRARQDYLNSVIEFNRAQFSFHWALGYPVLEALPR